MTSLMPILRPGDHVEQSSYKGRLGGRTVVRADGTREPVMARPGIARVTLNGRVYLFGVDERYRHASAFAFPLPDDREPPLYEQQINPPAQQGDADVG